MADKITPIRPGLKVHVPVKKMPTADIAKELSQLADELQAVSLSVLEAYCRSALAELGDKAEPASAVSLFGGLDAVAGYHSFVSAIRFCAAHTIERFDRPKVELLLLCARALVANKPLTITERNFLDAIALAGRASDGTLNKLVVKLSTLRTRLDKGDGPGFSEFLGRYL